MGKDAGGRNAACQSPSPFLATAADGKGGEGTETPEVLALKHESKILGQWSNPESCSRKSQASSPWAKQHRVSPVPSWRNHVQGWMTVQESYSRALERGTLTETPSVPLSVVRIVGGGTNSTTTS